MCNYTGPGRCECGTPGQRIGFKLFKLRKDGSLGPLFINARQRVEIGVEYAAEQHRTKGFAFRPGWHVCSSVDGAPHLSKKGRVWARVLIRDYTEHRRPASQGGLWFTANRMTVLEVL
jgi:hypothetical protein